MKIGGLTGLCRCRPVEVDDVDSNRCGQARRVALPVDLGNELVDVGLSLPRNLQQSVPHDRLEPHAGAMTRHDDVTDHQR